MLIKAIDFVILHFEMCERVLKFSPNRMYFIMHYFFQKYKNNYAYIYISYKI